MKTTKIIAFYYWLWWYGIEEYNGTISYINVYTVPKFIGNHLWVEDFVNWEGNNFKNKSQSWKEIFKTIKWTHCMSLESVRIWYDQGNK